MTPGRDPSPLPVIDLNTLVDTVVARVVAALTPLFRPATPSTPARVDRLTVADIAAELKVDAETVRGWIRRGYLRAARIGMGGAKSRVWRVTRADLDAFVTASAPTSEEEQIEAQVERILRGRRKAR